MHDSLTLRNFVRWVDKFLIKNRKENLNQSKTTLKINSQKICLADYMKGLQVLTHLNDLRGKIDSWIAFFYMFHP